MNGVNGLGTRDVHIWYIDLNDVRLSNLTALLSPDEIARARRFQTPQLAIAFQRCRVALRTVLGHYLEMPPGSIQFIYSPQGKPLLPENELHFNVSHSKNVALIAVSRLALGVDLEFFPSRMRAGTALYETVCHCSERIALAAMPAAARARLFCKIWTRKEAYFKAVGSGLRGNPAAVSFAPAAGGALLVIDEKAHRRQYYVHELAMPQPEYTGALCVDDADACLTLFDIARHGAGGGARGTDWRAVGL